MLNRRHFILGAAALPLGLQAATIATWARDFIEGLWLIEPDSAVLAGRFEFVHLLAVPNAARRQREAAFWRRWRSRLAAIRPETLPAAERMDLTRRVQLSQVQLTSYFSGYSEIMALREQWIQRLDARLEAFHERFPSFGNAPVREIAKAVPCRRSGWSSTMRDRQLFHLVAAIALVLAAPWGPCCARPAAARAPMPWPAYVARFQESYFAAHPEFGVYLGRHEFDGRLPDFSARGLQREVARLTEARRRATAYTDATLNPRQRFERDYVLSRIDADLFWLRDARDPFHNPAYYQGSLDPSVYLNCPYAPLPVRMKAFIAYARAVPKAVQQINANLKAPMPRTFVALGIDTFGGYASFYRDVVPTVFADVHDAALRRRLAAAIEPAAKAMSSFADRLRAEQAQANDDFAMGPEKFAAMLRMTELVDTPLAELEAMGEADLKRNLDGLAEACAAHAPGADVRTCVDRVNADKPTGGAIEGARAQLATLRQFIVDKDLMTIPGPELALVGEAPVYQRWNSAYIDIAGPYEKNMPSVYRISPPDPAWPAAEQLAYLPSKSVLLFTSVHEVWPGHFLQLLHAKRSSFPFGRVFGDYAYGEGWAHYTEEMMWEAGLGEGAPEVHIGQLLEALVRNVRLVCAIGMHTRGMSVAECETLFREQAFADPGNARQQAARGTFDPGYLNYTLGKMMIRQLREDWTASRGGRQAWKAFHDAFLSHGGPPIPLVREQMMGRHGGSLFGR